MHTEKGEIIGIVGESGCGKSTFLKLLLRFWQKGNGEIKFGGVDVDSINTDELLKNVTMVSQTTYLFDETIEDNLRIAKPDATQEEIEAACRMASVHEFILSLPMATRRGSGRWAIICLPAKSSVSAWREPSCGEVNGSCSMSRPAMWTASTRVSF